MSQRPAVDVAVVGAGISGLATAFYLQRAGLQVVVLEKAARPGGVVQSLRREGFLIETGPNSSPETSPVLKDFFQALGVESERIYALPTAKKRYVLRGGRLHPLPLSPLAFLTSPLFSWRAKFRLLREPWIKPAPPEVEESVADFVRRRLGEEFLHYAVDPFVSGVYAGNPERLSLPVAFPKLHQLEQRYGSLIRGAVLGARERKKRGERSRAAAPLYAFREGMETPIGALSGLLGERFQREVTVQEVAREEDWFVLRGTQRDEGREWRARAVVFAIPAHAYQQIDFRFPLPAREALGGVEYAPVVVVALGFHRHPCRHPLDGFGFLVPGREGRNLLGTLFNSSIFPERAPAGGALLTSFLGGSRLPELQALSDQQLLRTVQRELEELLGLQALPDVVHIQRWSRAIPQYTLGYSAVLAAIRRSEEAVPGLFIGGNFRGGIGFSECILQARERAGQVQRFLAGVPEER
ncbi:MAG: protoporphyrinogen oxidase [Calditrichaeota bacterium]|nr:MAG: protoporphyrinogen oxidase [Calditrichota bacterium]